MGFLGAALIALGVVGLIYGIMQRMKAGRVTDAPLATTGDVVARGAAVAGPKGQISAQGNVMCQQPLYSPMTGTPCLYYELKVESEWKDGDTVKKHEHEHEHQKVAAQFAINDGSGPVWVDLRQGGDLEPTQKKEQSQETGLLKGIIGGELVFGNYRLKAGIGNLGTKYTVTEEVLPVQQFLYVCGKLGEGGGMIAAPGWRNLIVSNQNRDQLLAAATKTSKIALGVGGGGLLLGIILVVVSSMMGKSAAEIQAEADAAASASAASASAAAAAATDAPSADPSDAPTSTAAVPAKKGVTTPTKATATSTATAAPAATTATPAATSTAATRPTATSAVATPKPGGIILKPKK